ncbi:MAG: hypothetical protein H6Q33_111 [Deltaproteobacteria bacterium]|nr:hypothetical protein [Deltaproteobacteria bacterium]
MRRPYAAVGQRSPARGSSSDTTPSSSSIIGVEPAERKAFTKAR